MTDSSPRPGNASIDRVLSHAAAPAAPAAPRNVATPNGRATPAVAPVFDHLFLSVGAMKAGTTWIYDVLSRHPDIHASTEKEVHYFYAQTVRPAILSDRARMRRARGYLAFDPEKSMCPVLERRVRWAADWLSGPVDDAWFNRLFAGRGNARWIADFSNLNALVPAGGWAEIHARTRKLRLLYTLREPKDRIWSHVRFHLNLQGLGHKLTEWSDAELIAHVQGGDYLEHSDYVAALGRMRAGLPSACVHVAFFDDISRDPHGFIRGVEGHLDLPHAPPPDEVMARVVNPSPPRPMPPALSEALEGFARAQVAGLRALGLDPPASWG